MKPARGTLLAGALIAASACTQARDTGPRVTAAPSADPPPPVSVPLEADASARAGPRTNQYGGEVPEPAPIPPVDEGGLGDVRPG